MDISALRKLSMTLKPLIEITDVLEKIENADQQLASIKGRTVAAQREYDALITKTAQNKAEAEKSIASKIEKATKEAEGIVERAKVAAEAATKVSSENTITKLNDLKKKTDKAELELQERTERLKKATEAAVNAEARLQKAENSLAEIRAAYAAVRI